MNVSHFFRASAIAVALACAAGPGLAQGHGGGHVSGGHVSAGHSGGAHFGGQAHVAAQARFGATRFAPARVASRNWGGSRAFVRGPGYHGYRGNWGGGYWGGRFWPGAYYGAGFAWFLPILPAFYATYWWDGVPYYYANDVYYTWDSSADGYVASDPPPVTGTDTPAATDNASANAYPSGTPNATADGVFAYPTNNQSEAQQATDRNECRQWASSQTGAAGNAGNGQESDYHRAMVACMDGRGYSAK